MSQIYKTSGSSPPPPSGVLELTPDSGAAVVPDGSGNINLTGAPTGVNQSTLDSNFETFNAGTNTMQVAHRYQGTATTAGDTTQTIVTIPVTAASTMTALALITGIEATGPNGVGGQITGVVFNNGGVATLLTTSDKLIGTTAPVSTATFAIGVSGANLIVTVTGTAGLTIEWYAVVTISQKTSI